MEVAFHQSTVKSYLSCPRSFKYRYHDQIQPKWRGSAAVHGTVLHRMIERLHSGGWNLDAETVYQMTLADEEAYGQDCELPIFWKGGRDEQIAKLTEEAVEMIEGYRDKDYNREATVALAEAKFMLKLGRNVYAGTIDQLRDNGDGTYTLVDFKTSQFQPDPGFLDVDYQMGLYAYALWKGVFTLPDGSMKMMQIPPEKLTIIWYHLRDHLRYKRATNGHAVGEEKGDPLRYTSRTREQLAELKRDLSDVASSIKRGVFPRNPDQQRCGWCAFSEMCLEDSRGNALNRKQQSQVQQLMEKVA